MADKTPAFLHLPFCLKSFLKIYLQLSTDMFSRISFSQLTHTKSFSFLAPLNWSVLRQHSGVISSRGTVVPAFRPSGGPPPIRASHRGQPFSDWLTLIEGIQLCLRRKLSEKGEVSGQVALSGLMKTMIVTNKQKIGQDFCKTGQKIKITKITDCAVDVDFCSYCQMFCHIF